MHEATREIEKTGAERYVSLAWHHHCIAPLARRDLLAIDCDHLERIGMNVKDVVGGLLIDDRPFLDGPKRNALTDTVRIESVAAHEVGEFLVVAGGRIFRFERTQCDEPLVGD